MGQPVFFFFGLTYLKSTNESSMNTNNNQVWKMYVKKAFVLMAAIFLLTAIANAETLNDIYVVEKITITDISKADISVQEAIWNPDGSKLLIRCTRSTSPSESVIALYVMNADGTDFNKLVSIPNAAVGICISSLAWSPSGDKIVFHVSRLRSGGYLAIINPDGTRLNAIGTNFTDMESILESLTVDEMQRNLGWSPDGTKMAFEWETGDGTYIYVADGDGSNFAKLYFDASSRHPVWSYDSKKIAFKTKNSLMCIDVNGNGLTYLSNGTEGTKYGNKYLQYSWSPDNSKLLYVAATKEVDDKEQFAIFVTDADGSGTTEIICGSLLESYPRWNPEGSKILFKKAASGNHELYTADADGKNLTLLQRGYITQASWNPTGNKIIFMDNHTLYTINPDGTDKTTLTTSPSFGRYSSAGSAYAWNPAGDTIAFSSIIDPINGKKVDFDTSFANLGSYGGSIFLSNSDGTEPVQVTESKGGRYDVIDSWSPDGGKLMVMSIIASPEGEINWGHKDVFILNLGINDVYYKKDSLTIEKKPEYDEKDVLDKTDAVEATETKTSKKEDSMDSPGFTSTLLLIGLLASFFYISKNERQL